MPSRTGLSHHAENAACPGGAARHRMVANFPSLSSYGLDLNGIEGPAMNLSEHRNGSEFRFGEGRISGWISVLLGSLSLLGVICFQFPDFLTTPQLRQAYTADEMRY